MSIRLELEGFDELLKKIERAGGSIDRAAEKCIRKSAEIMEDELRKKMKRAKVSSRLIEDMPPYEIIKEGNRYSARVGYRKGAYNPQNPSDGYNIVFINYGTPNRKLHGQIKPRGFIKKAKNAAKRKIKKQQESMLQEILEELE